MEDDISEMLRNASSGAPRLGEPPRRVLQRARAHRTFNALGVAVLAAGLVAGGIGAAHLLGSSEGRGFIDRPPGGVVPWINDSAPSPPSSPRAGAPMPAPCGATDLKLAPVETGGAAGSVGGDLTFTTRTRCTIDPDRFTLVLLNERRETLKTAYSHSGSSGVVAETLRQTMLFFVWGNWCEKSPALITVAVRFADGATLEAPIKPLEPKAPMLTPPCMVPGKPSTIDISAAGATGPNEPPILEGVVAEMDVPESARAGTRLRYLVVLHNTTTKPVALEPCPAYTEMLTSDTDQQQSRRYRLNCAGAGGPIGPDERVTFEMFFDIDPATPPGIYVISWLVDRPGPANKVPIRIV